ncbi:MAG: carbohydrate kinase [Bacteroidetes bacterium CHB5]|nr:carbohydrate kinase [Bacteroidetes bacterium CHB5]
MATPVIAIFDIGKTNKKLFLFDEDYQICFEKSEQLHEIKDEDGFPCEDIEALTAWVKNSFDEALTWSEFQIKALNVSAHGASFVHLDKSGKPVAPLYNYLKPYPEKLKQQFYQTYGGESDFARTTASPVLGNLNSGTQLYWLKHERNLAFEKIACALHLPEYISYLFTGIQASGITSIGCHTNLWNFNQNKYHDWVIKEGIANVLAPIRPSNEANRVTYKNIALNAGIGLHDSSAALIPYLTCFQDPFVLLSTGTWCISLNPSNHTPLTYEELAQDCLCYLTYDGNPVKAARLFSGYEHEQETKKLAEHFHVAEEYYKGVSYDPSLIMKLSGSRYVPEKLDSYSTYEQAYTHLIMHLVDQQIISTNRVLKNSAATCIFVDGGFSQNAIYMKLLSQAYPELPVHAASVAQATSVGAALAIHPYWNSKPLPTDLIHLTTYTKD